MLTVFGEYSVNLPEYVSREKCGFVSAMSFFSSSSFRRTQMRRDRAHASSRLGERDRSWARAKRSGAKEEEEEEEEGLT